MDIIINDDNIQEPAEYFLLVLDKLVEDDSQGSSKEELNIDPTKQCSKIKIDQDKDGK